MTTQDKHMPGLASQWFWYAHNAAQTVNGDVLAIDPRDAVSKALTSEASGDLLGKVLDFPIEVLDLAPGNHEKCFFFQRGEHVIAVWTQVAADEDAVFMDELDAAMSAWYEQKHGLKPCPFCGRGKYEILENGKIWTGQKYSEPASVSVRHWCTPLKGQPVRSIERAGRDLKSAIAAWNQRAGDGQGEDSVLMGQEAVTPSEPEIDGDEVVVQLASGWSLRSSSSELMSGDYVRLCDPNGKEHLYWDHTEWKDDPVVVMGAIMNAAAGLRTRIPSPKDATVESDGGIEP